MPELPFLQVLVENLESKVAGRTVSDVWLISASVLKTFDPQVSVVRGRRIERVSRAGKVVVFKLDGGTALAFHLMRNGRFQIGASKGRPLRPPKDLALILAFNDGSELRFVEIGPKKRAAVYVLEASTMHEREPLAGLGVDPLSDAFTVEYLRGVLEGDTAQLKHVLTLQRYLTGLGNAFSDEILWEAALSPFIRTSKLTGEEITRLHEAIRSTLTRALDEHRREFVDELPMKEPLHLLRVHRHAGEPCPRCGTRIAQVAYAEKETYYCPSCQTGGKVYADRRLSRLLK